MPPNLVFGGGVWIGEVLVDRVGKVAHVWTVRPVAFTPPFPQFNAAIIEAVQQWEFAPVRVDEEPMPFWHDRHCHHQRGFVNQIITLL